MLVEMPAVPLLNDSDGKKCRTQSVLKRARAAVVAGDVENRANIERYQALIYE
jgi:hypothetical protein